jgi:hypothetical protein
MIAETSALGKREDKKEKQNEKILNRLTGGRSLRMHNPHVRGQG